MGLFFNRDKKANGSGAERSFANTYDKEKVKPAIRWAGVSPEGWCRDDAGWRYRLADGTYCRAAERMIDGAAYRFDDNGYVTE